MSTLCTNVFVDVFTFWDSKKPPPHERQLAAEKLKASIESARLKREEERLQRIKQAELADKRKRAMIKLKSQQILQSLKQFNQQVKKDHVAFERFHMVSKSRGFSYFKK